MGIISSSSHLSRGSLRATLGEKEVLLKETHHRERSRRTIVCINQEAPGRSLTNTNED